MPRTFIALLATFFAAGCSPVETLNAVSPSAHYQRIDGLAYGAGPSQRLDVYRPAGASARAPVVVFFYGGGWKEGARENFEFVASSLTRAGIIVVIPDYRRYPEVRFPTFVEDGAAATAWVFDNLDRLRARPDAVFLMGHSAGAHIAALLAMDERYLEDAGIDAAPRGWIGLSGPYDFLPIESGYLQDVFPEASREASQPISYVTPGDPPALLMHGGDDTTVEPGNTERLAERLREAGVDVTVEIYEDLGHAALVASLAPPLDFMAATLEDSQRFIERLTASPDTSAAGATASRRSSTSANAAASPGP
jgi:acetyl esterase/lipase